MITVDNYILNKSAYDILTDLSTVLTNGKLRFFRQASSGISVPCPFHASGQEQHNSCYVDPDSGVFHCFACGAKGPFYHFVAGCFDSSDDYAKQWLIKHCGTLKAETLQLEDEIVIGKKFLPQKYLDESILETYQSWAPYLTKRKLSRAACQKLQIKYDPANRQIIFPVFDINGKLISLARRSVDLKLFHLDKTIAKPIYCVDQVVKNKLSKVVITEGPIDAVTCWSHNVPAIATFGSISKDQINQLNSLGITVLYLCFDNDQAGQEFNKTIKKFLNPRILTVDVEIPAGCKDVNDIAPENWPDFIEKNNLPKIEI